LVSHHLKETHFLPGGRIAIAHLLLSQNRVIYPTLFKCSKSYGYFLSLWSKLPAQPTQNNTSGSLLCALSAAIVGISILFYFA